MFRLTLKQCAYFVAVAEHGGIAQASRALNISQPAVAQAIEKLEHLFKLKLFERHHARGAELTLQGRSFLVSANKLLKQADITEKHAHAIAADNAGLVRLGCFHTIAPYYLPQIISAYNTVFPDVEIAPCELRQDEIMNALAAGEIDLALTYDMSLSKDLIDFQTMIELQPYLLVSEDHPFSKNDAVYLADIAKEPFVMFEGPSSREYFESIFTVLGITPNIAYRSKSMESVRSAVANGLGFSLGVIEPKYKASADAGRAVSVPISDQIDPLSVVLARRKGAVLSGQMAQLASFCRQYFHNITQ
jgi:DNA-binding transcriptional LysR family regulator